MGTLTGSATIWRVAVAGGSWVRPPPWYWVVAILALAWSISGCLAYLSQVNISGEALARLPAAQREIWAMMPPWVLAAYAVAVWGNLIGSVGLLIRRKWARPLFVLALIGVIVQFGWTFTATPIWRTVGPAAALFPIFILLVGLLLIGVSGKARRRGWLR